MTPKKSSRRASLANRLRYQFDKTLARGPMALGGWLALISLGIILLMALGVDLARIYPDLNLPQILWTLLLQALAPNPVDVNAGPWAFLGVMLLVTLLGIFMVSIFIGIITNVIDNRIQALRRGRSLVVEKGHTVILGWDEHIFTILSQLAIASETRKRAVVVVMGNKDKVEMEDEIRARVNQPRRIEVVCRNGSPMDMVDLEVTSLNSARSIIVLAPDGPDADTCVIKSLLAIVNNPHRRRSPYHIVTEIHDEINLEAARLVGRNEASILLVSDIIAHIIAQTCRQSGLSVVYTDLLNFEGDEIYFSEEPKLVGRTYGEALVAYDDCAVIGLRPRGGRPRLNPPMNTSIGPGDKIIAVAENELAVRLSGVTEPPMQANFVNLGTPAAPAPEATLILGWNKRAATIITELDNYVAPGSSVHVVALQPEAPAQLDDLLSLLRNQSVVYEAGDCASRRTLNRLDVRRYQHVIVLADLGQSDVQLADAHTLVTLLHLRDIAAKGGHTYSIVSEMLDVRNRGLAEVTRVDDFIVSDELASLLMTQIAANPELAHVFDELFYSEGPEIFLKPAGAYVVTGQPVNFYTVVEAARQRNESAIGYRIAAHAGDPTRNFGVVLNPLKDVPVHFHPEDRVIVLSEE